MYKEMNESFISSHECLKEIQRKEKGMLEHYYESKLFKLIAVGLLKSTYLLIEHAWLNNYGR